LFFYVAKFSGSSLNEKFVKGLSDAGADPRLASLIYALLFVLVNFLPAWWLYKRKIFIKL
jgi:predicted acyltransferase